MILSLPPTATSWAAPSCEILADHRGERRTLCELFSRRQPGAALVDFWLGRSLAQISRALTVCTPSSIVYVQLYTERRTVGTPGCHATRHSCAGHVRQSRVSIVLSCKYCKSVCEHRGPNTQSPRSQVLPTIATTTAVFLAFWLTLIS